MKEERYPQRNVAAAVTKPAGRCARTFTDADADADAADAERLTMKWATTETKRAKKRTQADTGGRTASTEQQQPA